MGIGVTLLRPAATHIRAAHNLKNICSRRSNLSFASDNCF